MDWGSAGDQELWSQAVDEHAGPAFGELFERHADRIYAHCFRRTGSWSMAEDLTSAVFLEAWRKRREVRFSGDSALPWLLAVANNATRNAQRTLRRHRRLLVKLPPAGDEPDIADTAVQRVDQERMVQHLLCAMEGLREPEQEVLALCDWAGLSYAEAAEALGTPEGTVRSRLSRARQHLRKLAEGDGPASAPPDPPAPPPDPPAPPPAPPAPLSAPLSTTPEPAAVPLPRRTPSALCTCAPAGRGTTPTALLPKRVPAATRP
jgi:RNA polymerase sigma factor (sigma-70 family)